MYPKPPVIPDYTPSVKPSTIKNGPKVHRNQLCPCGSKLKYKKCCINNKSAE